MATRLAAFATTVHECLATQGITATKRDDTEALQVHDVATRVVWRTPGGTVEPPKQAGGRISSAAGGPRAVAVKTRIETVYVHIFGSSRETTETLLDQIIAAICEILTIVEMPRYAWASEERDNSGHALRVHECVLTFELPLPVIRETKPIVTITSQDHICEFLINGEYPT